MLRMLTHSVRPVRRIYPGNHPAASCHGARLFRWPAGFPAAATFVNKCSKCQQIQLNLNLNLSLILNLNPNLSLNHNLNLSLSVILGRKKKKKKDTGC